MLQASFNSYMNLPLRKALTSQVNDGTINPSPLDAGNWTGGVVGVGKLIGTYRDISAVALSSYLGREATVEDLRALTEASATKIIKSWWDAMRMGEVPNQDVANIVFHLRMHFGNVRIAQKALNSLGESLNVDGQMGPTTLEALKRQTRRNALKVYSVIRNMLKETYEKSPYKTGFMRFLTEDFPEKKTVSSKQYWFTAAIIMLAIALVWYVYKYFKNNYGKY